MLRRLLFSLCLLAATSFGAAAQVATTGAGAGAPGGYTGPGDIVSGATAWYGLRCYNAAKASASQATKVRRNSDSTESDIGLTAACALDTATATTFAGTYSFTGSITTTTLTVTSISGTPIAVGDVISGTGVSTNTIITALGTGTGGTGTYTVSISQTVVSETISAVHGLFVSKAYDQSGNTKDASQATAANQPQLFLSGGTTAGQPYIAFVRASAQRLSSAAISAVSQPWSLSTVSERTGSFTSASMIIAANGTTLGIRYKNAVNTIELLSTTILSAAASDSAWHTFQGVLNGASSVISVDGAETAGDAGSSATGTTINLGESSTGSSPLDGNIVEAGVWPLALTSGNRTALNANQHTYWGF